MVLVVGPELPSPTEQVRTPPRPWPSLLGQDVGRETGVALHLPPLPEES